MKLTRRGNSIIWRLFLCLVATFCGIIVLKQIAYPLTCTYTFPSDVFTNQDSYSEDLTAYKTRKTVEIDHRKRLDAINRTEIRALAEKYHRDVSIQWRERALLPPSKDIFHENCLQYTETVYDETVTVVIVFYNELLMMLLRTLTTLVYRTPPRNLLEIILIDDRSEEDLEDEIIGFASSMKIPVRYYRNDVRMGITESRLKGIQHAEGSVVVIFDSHVEVMELWLQPLLGILRAHPQAIAVPCMQMIMEGDYEKRKGTCKPNMVKMRFGFGLLMFAVTPPILDESAPYPSPAIAGGAMAAYKTNLIKYFPRARYGKSWGVENNKLSLRFWLCGEGIFMSSCSQILHANGNDPGLSRYTGNDRELFAYLAAESIVEAWTFISDKESRNKLLYKTGYPADSEIVAWMTKLYNQSIEEWSPLESGCKSYEYYLRNVVPDHVYFDRTDFNFVGTFKSALMQGWCLENSVLVNNRVSYWDCRHNPAGIGDLQTIGFAKNGGVKTGFPDAEGSCWDAGYGDDYLIVGACHTRSAVLDKHAASQKFRYDPLTGTIEHIESRRCVTLVLKTDSEKYEVKLKSCGQGAASQKWEIVPAKWF